MSDGSTGNLTESRVCMNITYDCNARCRWCDRGCDVLDGTGTTMSMRKIKLFVRQMVRSKFRIINFRISGGEPTLVPHLREAVELIDKRLVQPGIIEHRWHVGTNGLFSSGPRESMWSRDVSGLPKLPKGWRYRVDTPHIKGHWPFWWSPTDFGLEKYVRMCNYPTTCGRAVDYKGWLICPIIGRLGMVLGIDPYHDFPPAEWHYEICRHCYKAVSNRIVKRIEVQVKEGKLTVPSPTWAKALETAKLRPGAVP